MSAEEYARARARAEASSVTPKRKPKPIDPSAVSRQDTQYGQVVQFGGFRVYYGSCKECGSLVHTRREGGGGGAWPSLCDPCRDVKAEAHADGGAGRMRRARTKYGPVNDLRRFNGDHHHKDDDEFGTPDNDVEEDHWAPRHRSTKAKAMRHQRTAPGDYPRGTTPGREDFF